MAPRTLPNVGLSGFWTLGEDNWKDAMDRNLLTLSVVVQGVVDSMVASLPGSPSDGDVHVLTTTGNIHVRDAGAWVELVVGEGWRIYDLATETTYRFDGTTWETFGEGVSSIDDLSDVDLTDVAEGSLLYWDGSALVNLGIGTAGQVLTVNSGADAPEWAAAAGGGSSALTWVTESGNRTLTDADFTGLIGIEATGGSLQTFTFPDTITALGPLLILVTGAGGVTFATTGTAALVSNGGLVDSDGVGSHISATPLSGARLALAGHLA